MISAGQEALDHKLTHRDLEHTPDDGNCYEIIDGILYVTPFPTYLHQEAATALTAILYTHVREYNLGKVFAAGLKVVLDEPTGVGPDIVYISAEHMDRMQRDGYYGAPDLVVEVLSSKPQLDRYIKLNKYAQAHVPNYWIVDPEPRVLWDYQLQGNQYRLAGEHREAARFEPALFPGLAIMLADLWA